MEADLFQLRLPAVHPDQLSLGELAELLEHTEKAIRAQVQSEDPDTPPDDYRTSLVSIHDGSTGLDLRVAARAVPTIIAIGIALSTSRLSRLAPGTVNELESLRGFSARVASPIEVRHGPDFREVLGAILPDVPIRTRLRVSGETDLYGRLLRVGGVEPRAAIELDTGQRLAIDLANFEMAQKVAPLLYRDIGLRGTAQWMADTWEITSFRASDLLPYRGGDVVEGFVALRRIAGPSWDAVEDVDAFLDGLRGSGEE